MPMNATSNSLPLLPGVLQGLPDGPLKQSLETQEHHAIWELLEAVTDPEIPVVNLREMGILRAVRQGPNGLEVVITPTYSGCPAMGQMEDDVANALSQAGVAARVITQLAGLGSGRTAVLDPHSQSDSAHRADGAGQHFHYELLQRRAAADTQRNLSPHAQHHARNAQHASGSKHVRKREVKCIPIDTFPYTTVCSVL